MVDLSLKRGFTRVRCKAVKIGSFNYFSRYLGKNGLSQILMKLKVVIV